MGVPLWLTVLAFSYVCFGQENDHYWYDPTGVPPIETFYLEIDPAQLSYMNSNPYDTTFEAPLNVTYKGTRYYRCGLQVHGGFSRSLPKKNYRLSFDGDSFPMTNFFHYKGDTVNPLRHVLLSASFIDPTFARNKMTFDVARMVGGLSPRSTLCETYINGVWYGLYICIERIDDDWAEYRQGWSRDGNIYKAFSHDGTFAQCCNGIEKTNNEVAPWDDLVNLIAVIGSTPRNFASWEANVWPLINLRDWFQYHIAHVFPDETDGMDKNWYSYHDPLDATAKFRMISWDSDSSWGLNWDGNDRNPDSPYLWGKGGGEVLSEYSLRDIEEYRLPYLTMFNNYLTKGILSDRSDVFTVYDMLNYLQNAFAPYAAQEDAAWGAVARAQWGGRRTMADSFDRCRWAADYRRNLLNGLLASACTFDACGVCNGPIPIGQDCPESTLRITEIMTFEGQQFVELSNVGPNDVELAGFEITGDIHFRFSGPSWILPAGQFIILIENPETYGIFHPNETYDGVYEGKLGTTGLIELRDLSYWPPVVSISYSDASPWPAADDCGPHSLTFPSTSSLAAQTDGSAWKWSNVFNGSPKEDDPNVPYQCSDHLKYPILVNEILARPDATTVDSVELYNPNAVDVNLRYWFLTDSLSTPKLNRLTKTTFIVPAGGYLVLKSGDAFSFGLGSDGDDFYLLSAFNDIEGTLTGLIVGWEFDGSEIGQTYGRIRISTGEDQLTPTTQATLNGPNAPAKVGPLYIKEIFYWPKVISNETSNILPEYLRIASMSAEILPLDLVEVSGIGGFVFPNGSTIEPFGEVFLTRNAGEFLTYWPSVPSNKIFEYIGKLSNDGDDLKILWPLTGAILTVSDQVKYSPEVPWPQEARGNGASLWRISEVDYGGEPLNWMAVTPEPELSNPGHGCSSATDCPTISSCTTATCPNSVCVYVPKYSAGDCTQLGNDCLIPEGYCAITTGSCAYLAVEVEGCCSKAADCNDGQSCTIDTCLSDSHCSYFDTCATPTPSAITSSNPTGSAASTSAGSQSTTGQGNQNVSGAGSLVISVLLGIICLLVLSSL